MIFEGIGMGALYLIYSKRRGKRGSLEWIKQTVYR